MIDVKVDSSGARAKFERFSPALREALARHVERFEILIQSYVRENKLSGDPLHRRTGNLSGSINTSPVSVLENLVSGSVGTNIIYARVHEQGGTVEVPAHSRTATMVFGREVNPFVQQVRAHTATYPQRAFLGPSLEENSSEFTTEMQAAVSEAADATG